MANETDEMVVAEWYAEINEEFENLSEAAARLGILFGKARPGQAMKMALGILDQVIKTMIEIHAVVEREFVKSDGSSIRIGGSDDVEKAG